MGGHACFGGVTCTNGIGPVTGAGGSFPFAAIDLSNSGGNSNLNSISIPRSIPVRGCASNCRVSSNYSGELLVKGNVLDNNFGGVLVYTDTNRYPGNVDDDSACGVPLGSLNQSNSTTYYQQTKELQTAGSGTVISGNSVTTSAGTTTFCDDYSATQATEGGGGGQSNVVQAPSLGMAVFDMKSGKLLGTVASVSSAHAFTLSRSPGDDPGATLLLSAYGGCGPADYYGGSLDTKSGQPAAFYWDNCIWGSRNVTVSGNKFSADASAITGCTKRNMCGYMTAMAFNAGVPKLVQFFDAYPDRIANASGGLGNVWSSNTYSWTGGGPGAWQFVAGNQGNTVTQDQWTSAPYDQDRGGAFTGLLSPPHPRSADPSPARLSWRPGGRPLADMGAETGQGRRAWRARVVTGPQVQVADIAGSDLYRTAKNTGHQSGGVTSTSTQRFCPLNWVS